MTAQTLTQPSPTEAPEPRATATAPAASRRIALVISSLSGGGAERVATALAAQWAAAGHRVFVVTLGTPDVDVYTVPAGVERVSLGLLRPSRNRLVGLVRALVRAQALRQAFQRIAPDVVVAFGDRTNVLALFATVGLPVRTVVSERTDPRHAPNGWQWKALRRVLYARADQVVVQTESVGAWARSRWSRVAVVPNFVAPAKDVAAPGADEGPRRLIAVGRLAPVKGFDLLCDAFARVAGRHPDWTLEICGEGPQRAALQERVARLGLAGRVLLPGRVANPAPRLAASHAFVLSSRHEGFPNALLEAMACGLPVVAFDCPSGPGEILTHGHDGLLVPHLDVEQLAAALDRVLSSGAERARMGLNARRSSLRYAPESILGLWSAILFAESSP